MRSGKERKVGRINWETGGRANWGPRAAHCSHSDPHAEGLIADHAVLTVD